MSELPLKIKELWPLYAANFSSKVIGIISRFILARFFLGPHDFGVFASVLVIAEIIILIGEAGCKKSVIVLEEYEGKTLGIAYSFMAIHNIFLMTIVYFLSGRISLWIGLSDGGIYLRVIIPFVIFFNISQIAAGSLNKRRSFIYQIKSQLTGSILFLIIAITMAYFDQGVMSLILAQGASMAAQGLITFLSLGLRVKISTDLNVFKRFMAVGISSLFANFQEFLGRNYDNLIIAIFCAKSELGAYFLAYTIISIPVIMIKSPLSEYMFSVLSQHRDETGKIRKFYFYCRSWDLQLIIPILGSLALLSDPFVEYVLGSKWHETSKFIIWLIPYALAWTIGANAQTLLALGKIKQSNKIVFVRTFLLLLVLPLAARYYSIAGVVWTITSIMVIAFIFGNALLIRELRASVFDYLKITLWGLLNLALGLILYGGLKLSGLNEGFYGFLLSVLSFTIPIIVTILLRKPNLKRYLTIFS